MRNVERRRKVNPGRLRSRRSSKFARNRGAQLVEFAFMLPLLLVMLVGIIDFGTAYTLKQKLNNAAREGARFAVSSSCLDCDALSPANTTKAIENVIVQYVNNKNTSYTNLNPIDTCGLTGGDTPSNYVKAPYATYTFTSPATCGNTGQNFVITIQRKFSYTDANGALVFASDVQLQYPYKWMFSNVITLLVPGASYTGVATISSDAIMENLPGT